MWTNLPRIGSFKSITSVLVLGALNLFLDLKLLRFMRNYAKKRTELFLYYRVIIGVNIEHIQSRMTFMFRRTVDKYKIV